MIFPYKVGEVAEIQGVSFEKVKFTAIATCLMNPYITVVMAEMPYDGYVVFNWSMSEMAPFEVEFHEMSEFAASDYLCRAFNVNM